MKELAQYLVELVKEKQRGLVLGHPHADPDAVGSAMGLGEILKSLGAEATIGIPSSLSGLSKSVLEKINVQITVDPPVKGDFVVVLDTSSLGQLKEYKEKIEDLTSKIIFIDHHHPDEKTRKKADKYYNDEGVSSTAELILELGQELNFDFSPKTATIMLTGIISDTGHFKFANKRTFESVAYLIKHGGDYMEALEALKKQEDSSKRVAILKAAQRSELHKSHGRWIVFSEVGAYESDAATMFVKIGADVSIIASSDNGKTRISGRSRSEVTSETHLHLGELMSKLADSLEGIGGGHAGAAGLTAEAELEKVKEEILKETKKMLKPREDQK